MFETVEKTAEKLAQVDYIADEGLATSLFLSIKMGKPLFLEGEPGVGKTEIAKVLAQLFDTDLIRLQCYEGLDINQALYEWNYPKQLLEMQSRNGSNVSIDSLNIFSDSFLLKRPLLHAIDPNRTKAPVLLIDELDRSDEEFESFLLELLSDFQITIPEIGTIKAEHRPIVIITSNRTREIHDALKRRCIYHWIDYPSRQKEIDIIVTKRPQVTTHLATQMVEFMQEVRKEEFYKLPGVAETLDWAEALGHLNATEITPKMVEKTLGIILKYQDDVDKLNGQGIEVIMERIS
ncbi:MAG: MoxR family ATPase [Chloroflexota bacterium]